MAELVVLRGLGKEWQKGDMHRVYFDGVPEWFGLRCEYYNSGNIQNARLNGEPISNSRAKRLVTDLGYARVWYDVATGQFCGKGIGENDLAVVVANIKAAAER